MIYQFVKSSYTSYLFAWANPSKIVFIGIPHLQFYICFIWKKDPYEIILISVISIDSTRCLC